VPQAALAGFLARAARALVAELASWPPGDRPRLSQLRDLWWIARREARKAALLDRQVREEELDRALFYDYWFENSTLALALLRSQGRIRGFVCRAHGFDLYDERWSTGGVPYRRFKLAQADRVFVISEHGARYLRARAAPDQRRKIAVHRLGVPEQTSPLGGRPEEPYRIISVSHTGPPKRVQLIPEVLRSLSSPVEWTHFGGGTASGKLERACSSLPRNISWRLAGAVPHDALISHYRHNRVDLFLSLSESEGIPVSMMEALSFGVPVLSCHVGAVGELVTQVTGRLLPESVTPSAAAAAILDLLRTYPFDRQTVRAFAREHFSAKRNFTQFASELSAVSTHW
jgi:glycosyltransferase involved in cell wall biosynthesis